MRSYSLTWILLTLSACTQATHQHMGGDESHVDFEDWGSSENCSMKAAREPVFNICMRPDDGISPQVVEQHKVYAQIAILTWLKAVRQIDPRVTSTIGFDCNQAAMIDHLMMGGDRSYASPGKINVFTEKKDGSVLHEMGHAFACLGDTYNTNTAKAGDCVDGQPQSVMCWGMYGKHDGAGHSLLYQDDIDGVHATYKRMFADVQPPDTSIDAQAPLDLNNPWPGANGVPVNNNVNINGLFVRIDSSVDPRQPGFYVMAPPAVTSIILCPSGATVCSAPSPQNSTLAPVVNNSGRNLFRTVQSLLVADQQQLTFIGVGANAQPILTKTIGLRSH